MDATCRCEHPLVGFKFGMGLRCRLCNNQLDLEAFERSRTADQKQADANVTALSNEVLRLRSTLSEAENQIAGLVNELDREREVSGKLRVALEAQVAALTAERDAEKQRGNEAVDLCVAMKARWDSETQWAKHYHDAWRTARQSRARLVAHVRRLRAWFSATAPDSAFVKRITDERDDARAWAAAWKRAAKWWWLAARDGSKHGMMNAWYRCEAKARRARRAAEFVETMEQR